MSDREGRTGSTGILAVTRREWRRVGSRPLYWMLLVVLPVAASLLLAAIFASGVPRDLPIVLVDADNSALSRRLARMIDATPAIRVAARAATVDEGRALILSNRAYALVFIPRDLERDVRGGRAPRVVAFVNSQYLLPASVIGRDLRRAAGTLSAGIELRTRQLRGASEAAAMRRLEPIRVDVHTVVNPELNYAAFLLPALVPTLLQIFVLMALIFAAGSELRDGTAAEWIATAGDSTARAIAGKTLPYAIHFTLLTIVTEAIALRAFGGRIEGSVAVLLLGAGLFVLACCALSVAIAGVTSNLRFGLSAGAFFSGPAFAFSGVTFPVFAMPAVAMAWSAILPLTHYVRIAFDQSMRGAAWHASLRELGALAFMSALFFAIGWLRLRVVCRDARYWGKL